MNILVEDIIGLLRKLKCTKEHIPIMLSTDPICKYNGWIVGQIVHAIEENIYRIIT